jgi:hypothetical protein
MSDMHRSSTIRDTAGYGRSGFLNSLSDAVRDNPLPAALIGMGVMWMFMGGSRMSLAGGSGRKSVFSAAGEGASQIGGMVRHTADKVGSSISATAEGAANLVSTASGTVADAATSTYDAASEAPARMGNQLQQNLSDLFDRQPLLLGAAGFALGAGIAASLPVSETEKQVMGKASGYVHEKVSQTASQVKEVANAAIDETRAQGLTPQVAKEAVREIGRAVGNRGQET